MRLGKPSPNFLRNVIYTNLGAQRSELLVGPTFGVDNAIYRIGPERVLVATTDPLSYLPSLGPRASAWLSVHLLASDLTTCGFSPQFGLLDFNLPPGLSDYNFARYWDSFSEECRKLGVSIIGGHTGRYPGIDYSIIGGGVAMAIVPRNRYLTSAMANDGDDIILTKGAAIETTAVLTRAFSRTVKKALGRKLFEKAWSYLGKVSTVDEALIASSVGVRGQGVTAMHDATEGGVIAGIFELATASKLGATVDLEEILVSEETLQLCHLFHLDPLVSLSEGSLIIASLPSKTKTILDKLISQLIPAKVVGRLTSKHQGYKAVNRKGTRSFRYPIFDPYWKAYSSAIRRGWS
ncbi:MAG: hypothetical protein AUF79_09420 [Crenarchaeota archaeon 13_1_20CM_2_51_8]|nr:MAG: hypothetical protein AUF79_09420 [Crenarchaeota archaeon 13_1_20CM_2_51_8]